MFSTQSPLQEMLEVPNLISSSIDTLIEAFKKDPSYLWSWQTTLAMSFYDAMPEETQNRHMLANKGAAIFIERLFNLDVSEHEEYKRFETIWKENN